MTIDQILDELMAREGGFVDDPVDKGQATKHGITAATLGNWRGWTRQATRAEVRALTLVEAKAIYIARYLEAPGFTAANIPDERVRVALIDDGVNSGPQSAIKRLQAIVGVKEDGVLGPQTIAAVRSFPPAKLLTELVKARCLNYGRIVQKDATQRRFIVGWLARALAYLPLDGNSAMNHGDRRV